jgi:hypothetical protein
MTAALAAAAAAVARLDAAARQAAQRDAAAARVALPVRRLAAAVA